MSNQRGITVSSTIGTIAEEIIFNRISKIVHFTQAQAGGRKVFSSVAKWRSRRVVFTGERSGGLGSRIHNWSTGKVPLAARRGIVASLVWGRVDVVRVKLL